eukprot:gene6732-3404_t
MAAPEVDMDEEDEEEGIPQGFLDSIPSAAIDQTEESHLDKDDSEMFTSDQPSSSSTEPLAPKPRRKPTISHWSLSPSSHDQGEATSRENQPPPSYCQANGPASSPLSGEMSVDGFGRPSDPGHNQGGRPGVSRQPGVDAASDQFVLATKGPGDSLGLTSLIPPKDGACPTWQANARTATERLVSLYPELESAMKSIVVQQETDLKVAEALRELRLQVAANK